MQRGLFRAVQGDVREFGTGGGRVGGSRQRVCPMECHRLRSDTPDVVISSRDPGVVGVQRCNFQGVRLEIVGVAGLVGVATSRGQRREPVRVARTIPITISVLVKVRRRARSIGCSNVCGVVHKLVGGMERRGARRLPVLRLLRVRIAELLLQLIRHLVVRGRALHIGGQRVLPQLGLDMHLRQGLGGLHLRPSRRGRAVGDACTNNSHSTTHRGHRSYPKTSPSLAWTIGRPLLWRCRRP
mmetsp:Transcript_37647/g.95340  ORF Transcript_37647/g.95340 Transcript_37647/m.95340 type:complete len:241 (+) Transcript_37647:1144-1866(+)